MRQLSAAGHDLINGIAQRRGFSFDATVCMLDSVINGNGSMAQFNHPEFAGPGQWMRGGMTMVSDMFNNELKGRVDGLCSELARVVAEQPDLMHSGGFGAPSLFVPGTSGDWWPSDLRFPNSTGAQNGVRYAYFGQARRLVIDAGGTVTVYDTLDHQIGGFSQQQSVGGTASFSSQYGLIDVTSLPIISSNGQPPQPVAPPPYMPQPTPQNNAFAHQAPAPTGNEHDVFSTIERLANLHAKGILNDDEFLAKKAELLSRL